ncbi:MAG: primosomal protein N', partial [Clostridiales bacterium]|nr:primosomal protein N' [Clostridiales bacterium]
HYCYGQADTPKKCPECGSEYIKYFGVGTQKIEEEIKKLFPGEKVLRMDMDTVSKKHSHGQILNSFRNQESKILIGTQMIAKGLDFPNVTLVGVLAADLSLNTGDFRCAEATFQLLVQVSGRAGRSDAKGEVIIQTYNPGHYSVVYAKSNDYENFYKEEIAARKMMLYPPFTNLFVIHFISAEENIMVSKLNKLAEIMKYYDRKGQFDIIGPSPAAVSKIKNKYRWRLIVKALDEGKIKAFVFYTLDKLNKYEDLSNIKINLTLNPIMVF